jgi:hypothetical protein
MADTKTKSAKTEAKNGFAVIAEAEAKAKAKAEAEAKAKAKAEAEAEAKAKAKAEAEAEAKAKAKAEAESEDKATVNTEGLQALRKEAQPVIVKLPKNPSSAQVEYAKILNQYAYTNTKKFEKKQEKLLERLDFLKDRELPEGLSTRLEIADSSVLYKFYFTEAIIDGERQIIDCAITLA